jgi:hypothetical protein
VLGAGLRPRRRATTWRSAVAHAGLLVLLDAVLFYGWYVLTDPQRLFALDQPGALGRYMTSGLVAGGIGSLVYLGTAVGLRLARGQRYVLPPSQRVWALLLGPTVAVIFCCVAILARPAVLPEVAGLIAATVLAVHGLILVTADWAVYAMTRLGVTTGQSALLLVAVLGVQATNRAAGWASAARPMVDWNEDLPALLLVLLVALLVGAALAIIGRLTRALAVARQWWQLAVMTWAWYYMGGAVLYYFSTARMPSAEAFMPTTLGQFLALLLVPLFGPWVARGLRKT